MVPTISHSKQNSLEIYLESVFRRTNLSSVKPQNRRRHLFFFFVFFFYLKSHNLVIVANIKITCPTLPSVHSTTDDLSFALLHLNIHVWHYFFCARSFCFGVNSFEDVFSVSKHMVCDKQRRERMDDNENDQKLFVRAFAGIFVLRKI